MEVSAFFSSYYHCYLKQYSNLNSYIFINCSNQVFLIVFFLFFYFFYFCFFYQLQIYHIFLIFIFTNGLFFI